MTSTIPSISKSCRPQLAFPSNPFVPLVQMPDLIFGLAILTLRKKSSNLAFAERLRVLPTDGRPIIHTLSDAEFATHTTCAIFFIIAGPTDGRITLSVSVHQCRDWMLLGAFSPGGLPGCLGSEADPAICSVSRHKFYSDYVMMEARPSGVTPPRASPMA